VEYTLQVEKRKLAVLFLGIFLARLFLTSFMQNTTFASSSVRGRTHLYSVEEIAEAENA
jgi:hypothetical protein